MAAVAGTLSMNISGYKQQDEVAPCHGIGSVVYPTKSAVCFQHARNATVLRLTPAGKPAKRILIVDDGPEVRQVIRAVFEARTDYEICGEASNGAEAIEMALALKPDLLLLDVAMPLLNGVEVASVLNGSMPQMPVVLYTMYNDLLGLSLATAVGARAVISKADGISKLLECLQNLLEPKTQPATEAPTSSPSNAALENKPPAITEGS
jgi:DNA-binding NarL/FixJ family response regulator